MTSSKYISQEAAFRHPERVQAMVIADGTCITWPHSAFDHWLPKVCGAMMMPIPNADGLPGEVGGVTT